MEESTMLILLTIVMLFGSYLAGSIPLVFVFSEAKMQLVSVFGAGLLVGTALAVIIPEGISSLMFVPSQLQKKHLTSKQNSDISNDAADYHSVIGFSLVVGFVLMLLIDQLSSRYARGSDIEALSTNSQSGGKSTATIGLVVHSAVDGVALGAAATTTHHDVEIIVFLAIMLHKAPAAFGLVTFLLHEGLDRKRIRRHLLIFSLSAPLLALLTYFFIGQEHKEKLSSTSGTGVAMLFSAGTFLYVATVHVLPELAARSMGGTFSHGQLLALVLGALAPLVLTAGHSH